MYVYITPKDGEKYHSSTCPSIQNRETKRVTLEWAKKHGYKKCKIKNG